MRSASVTMGQVVISQPVHQHAYETALAAQQATLLRCFVTGICDTGRGLTDPRFRRWLPRAAAERVERELRRRRYPGLSPDLVLTILRYHVPATAYRRLTARVPRLRSVDLDTWAHERFDAAVARWLRRVGPPAIVHAFEGSALATLRAAKERGATTVLDVASAHEYALRALREEGAVGAPSGTRPRVREERELANYLFAPSEYVVRCLLDNGVAAERIVRIPYGVNPEQFVPMDGRPDGKFRVLFVGQIGLRKGVRYLLEAWRRLDLPDAELILVGAADADGRRALQEYAGCYTWVGQVPKYEVQRWFQRSDVFAFPSLSEGSALVTYEAMAAGLPVVTTASAGAVVRDGADGFVVPTCDVDALCGKLAYLYEHREARREMGANGRGLIESRYTWSHYRQRVAAAYRAILEGRDPQEAVDEMDRDHQVIAEGSR